VDSPEARIQAELDRLRQKRRTFCGGPEAEALKLQIEALEQELAAAKRRG
jgi:uncharacterized protein involved in exopolysaccharide biosynthesis